jgi:hypothetical protein
MTMDDSIRGRTLRFLYEKAQKGELYAGLSNSFAKEKMLNVFDIIDSLAKKGLEQGDELTKYNVMYLRKIIIEKIVDDFDSWFSKSGIPLQHWEEHLVIYAKNYTGRPNW